MKKIFLFLLIIFFNFTKYDKSDISLLILNANVRDDEKITFQIKNNSKNDYCFIMDTVFPERSNDYYYYLNTFINPKLVIYDSQDKINSRWVKDSHYYENSEKNTKFNDYEHNKRHVGDDKLSLIFVKANTSVKLNMPFNLFIRENSETLVYYKLDNNKIYKCEIKYFIMKEFIGKRISSTVIDSVEKKGYKFFTGKLISNKVPLILK